MPRFGIIALALYTVVRASAALGQTAQRYPDSSGYDTLNFFSRTDRPWPIPLVYSFAESDTSRIAIQVACGVLAWGALAWAVSQILAWRKTSFAAILLLGLSPHIIRYDVAILSESLTISFVVMAIAATFQHLRTPRVSVSVWWASSLTVCVLSRPTHLLIAVACVMPVVWKFARSRGKSLSMWGVGSLALFAASFFTVQQSPHMTTLNLYTVLSSRVITDDARFEWFVSHGMPNIPGMRAATGYDYASQLPPNIANIVNLPVGQQPPTLMRVGGTELATWVNDNGTTALLKYLVLHPSDTMSHARGLLDSTLSPPNGDFLPLVNGPMIPWEVFLPWQIWVLAIVASCGLMLLKTSTRQRAKTLLAMTATASTIFIATVHTSGIEHVRHSVPVAVSLRVLGLLALLSLLPSHPVTETADEDS